MSMPKYDVFCHLCHMSAMTYDIFFIYLYGCLENRQDLSNTAPGFKVTKKAIFMQKKVNQKNSKFPLYFENFPLYILDAK